MKVWLKPEVVPPLDGFHQEVGTKQEETSGEKTGDKTGKKTGDKTIKKSSEKKHFTKRQSDILKLLIKDNSLKDVDNLSQINDSAIQKHFDNLKSLGAIRRMGPDKGSFREVLINF